MSIPRSLTHKYNCAGAALPFCCYVQSSPLVLYGSSSSKSSIAVLAETEVGK
ncbi:uncharacterized protein FOMMEDRAFT_20138 [Fomitiporia mediterranea MF3/22]|uniref:uncharacterized protein n=1 Tax=Fomitiporia mediterranea (strain MF3/22) TaxID=694068 RepID=UPI0004409808|nr:uncharacterized protein FOMMEDRAFT_20138 [Fomitiporia mediterranea MF3/22]EJD02942.1 hypothetical protein FOMMEDRAFT_20138 [Fomitiporia mediterranea MF3/22]